MAIPSTLVFPSPLFLLLMFWTIYLQFEYVETSTKKTFEREPAGNRGQMEKIAHILDLGREEPVHQVCA